MFSIQEKFAQQNLLSGRPLPENEEMMVSIITAATPAASVGEWRTFFVTDFSMPILTYVARQIFKKPSAYVPHIQGEYFIFISAEGGDKNTPYYKVSLFNRRRDSMLRTYVSTITVRYFLNEKEREDKRAYNTESIEDKTGINVNFSGSEVVENAWFALLISEGDNKVLSANDPQLMEQLREAISHLPEREKMVIEMTYFGECTGDEIYDELLLRHLVAPKCAVEDLTAKNKQTAVSSIRQQALARLHKQMSSYNPF